MKINIAHVRERAAQGGWIDFIVFDADSTSRTTSARNELLARLTSRARANRLKVDQSALAFVENGRLQFFGSPKLVDYLANNGLPSWTHQMDV